MAIVRESAEFAICDVCGTRWIHDVANPAKQCRNGKCKSRLWDAGSDAATMRAFWKSKNVGRPVGSGKKKASIEDDADVNSGDYDYLNRD